MSHEVGTLWLVFGFAAQGMFFMRFFVQWIHSERQGRSAVPVAFWWFSLVGGVMLFTYACVRRDPVFMMGQGMGLLIYSRNLMLIRKERQALAVVADGAPPLAILEGDA